MNPVWELIGVFIIFISSFIYTTYKYYTIAPDKNSMYPNVQLWNLTKLLVSLGAIILFLSTSAYLSKVPFLAIHNAIILVLVVGILLTIYINWNREQQVISAGDEPIIKTYSFILPIHTYNRSLKKWLKTLHPKYTIIEYHFSDGNSPTKDKFMNIPHKYIIEYKDESDLLENNLYRRESTYQVCKKCGDHSLKYAKIKEVWNNPKEQKTVDAPLCYSCYINLLRDIEEEIDEFTAPTDDLLAKEI